MIHVLTISWNGLKHLQALRPGLIDNLNKTGEDYIWHIRSNGCTDGTIEEISKWQHTRILKETHNRANFSQGVNSLFRQANPTDSDLVLLLNNDIVFKDDISLSNMLRLMQKTKSVMCGCRMMFPSSNKISHLLVTFDQNKNHMPWNFKMGELLTSNDKKNRYCQAVTAACCFVWARNFAEAGMLPENLHWAFEDVSLCLEISLNQKEKIVSCGQTEIEHATSATLQRNNLNKLFLQQNVINFKAKWFGKYEIDHQKYLDNPSYNEAKV